MRAVPPALRLRNSVSGNTLRQYSQKRVVVMAGKGVCWYMSRSDGECCKRFYRLPSDKLKTRFCSGIRYPEGDSPHR